MNNKYYVDPRSELITILDAFMLILIAIAVVGTHWIMGIVLVTIKEIIFVCNRKGYDRQERMEKK